MKIEIYIAHLLKAVEDLAAVAAAKIREVHHLNSNYLIIRLSRFANYSRNFLSRRTLRFSSLKSMTWEVNFKRTRATYPDNGIQFGHGDLLRPLHSVGHLLLMLQCHAIIIASSSHSIVRSHGTRAKQRVKDLPLAPGTEALARLLRLAF